MIIIFHIKTIHRLKALGTYGYCSRNVTKIKVCSDIDVFRILESNIHLKRESEFKTIHEHEIRNIYDVENDLSSVSASNYDTESDIATGSAARRMRTTWSNDRMGKQTTARKVNTVKQLSLGLKIELYSFIDE